MLRLLFTLPVVLALACVLCTELRDHMNTTAAKRHLLGARIAWAFR